ncbi:MAG TPA: FAD-dependent oxidoreductase [Gammaproteobacteria bacterium]|nr:FAD-dependent oxidoreductase [Gammaproteobacteria bacterium]
MGSKKLESVAIVGAGMAGVSCAAALRYDVPRLKIFEKMPSAGGRMCSFRAGEHQYDGGAQYFTARSQAFQQQIAQWKQNWLVAEWEAWLVDLHLGEALSREDGAARYVGRPVMQSCIEDMADLSEVQYQADVGKIAHIGERWELSGVSGEQFGDFDAVVIAVPAPQALPLLQGAPRLAKAVQSVQMMPCWSVMLAFEQPLNLGFDAAFLVMPKLTWAARDSSKPDRQDGEVWVLHGSPEWSNAHPEIEPIDVVMQFLQDFELATRRKLPMPAYVDARFWPVALTVNPLPEGHSYDPELKLGLCGDWCRMSRVEGAYLSGISLAAELLKYSRS